MADLRIGMELEQTFTVAREDCIRFASEGITPVLATPTLVWKLEQLSRELIQPVLAVGQTSVGAQLELAHSAPTFEGAEVTLRSRVIHIEGRVVSFLIEAHDAMERLTRGTHKRGVIDVERFNRRVERKRDQMKDQ